MEANEKFEGLDDKPEDAFEELLVLKFRDCCVVDMQSIA